MEKHTNEFFQEIERQIIAHEITPKDRLQFQMSLASDLFLVLGQDEKYPSETDTEFANRKMFWWTDGGDNGFSALFRKMEESEEFKYHPRFQGDMYRITPADILYYREHKILPEE